MWGPNLYNLNFDQSSNLSPFEFLLLFSNFSNVIGRYTLYTLTPFDFVLSVILRSLWSFQSSELILIRLFRNSSANKEHLFMHIRALHTWRSFSNKMRLPLRPWYDPHCSIGWHDILQRVHNVRGEPFGAETNAEHEEAMALLYCRFRWYPYPSSRYVHIRVIENWLLEVIFVLWRLEFNDSSDI